MNDENIQNPASPPGWYTDPWNSQQLRYFDGGQWTPHTAPPPAPVPAASPPAAPTLPLEESGYPFGEQTLILRAIATQYDASIMCGVENLRGEHIGLIRPTSDISWFTRGAEGMTFVLTRPDGAPLLHFTSSGGYTNHSIQVHDPTGRDLGRLRKSGSLWRIYTLTMEMEFRGQRLGRSKIGTTVMSMDKKVHEPIYDAAGSVLGHVDRQWHPHTGSRNPHYDYLLDCATPTPHPIPTLMLTIAFAHYMHDRIQMGGPLGGPRWKSRNN